MGREKAKALNDPQCKCGHPKSAHQHYRAGTDCSQCSTCDKFRRA